LKLTLITGLMAGAVLFGQTVTQVGNAASYGADIAQGSLFVAIGTNLGPPALTQASTLPLGTALAGTSIRFTPVAGGAAVDAFVVYTLNQQVAGILPSTTAPGEYNITVSFNGTASPPVRVRVVQRAYGMITLNSRGTGLAVIQNASDDSRVVQFTAPVRPGQVVVLWGTGLGPIRVPDNAAPGAQDLRAEANVRVIVGGVEVTPVYAGRSPSLPGADQINFTIPDNAPSGCAVTLEVRVAGQTAPPASIAIAPGGRAACEHPFLSEDSLRRIDAGQNLVAGDFTLSAISFGLTITGLPIAIPPIDVKAEQVAGSFSRLSLANIDDFSSSLSPPVGGCTVQRGLFDSSGQPQTSTPPLELDAGTITIAGPNVNRTLDRSPQNYYSALISDPTQISVPGVAGGGAAPAGLAAGTYTLTGAGGADVGPFTASVRISSPPAWTNRDAVTQVTRSNPLTVNWTPGPADDIVTVLGIAGNRMGGTAANPVFEGAVFTCAARANAGTLTVPVSILQQLPMANAITISGLNLDFSSIGLLQVGSANAGLTNGRFTAPLRAGGEIDFGLFGFAWAAGKTLPYR